MPSAITTAHLSGCAPCASSTQFESSSVTTWLKYRIESINSRRGALLPPGGGCAPSRAAQDQSSTAGLREQTYTVLLLESQTKIRWGSKLLNQPHAPSGAASLRAMFIRYVHCNCISLCSSLRATDCSHTHLHETSVKTTALVITKNVLSFPSADSCSLQEAENMAASVLSMCKVPEIPRFQLKGIHSLMHTTISSCHITWISR